MVNDNKDNITEQNVDNIDDGTIPDEQMHLFVYGNILIKDPESGDILVNKSF
jgi:hypothetical protein